MSNYTNNIIILRPVRGIIIDAYYIGRNSYSLKLQAVLKNQIRPHECMSVHSWKII